MDRFLDNTLLPQLSALVATKLGLHFPQARWHDLERGLLAAAASCGFDDATRFCTSLLAGPLTTAQIETLAAHLTIGETYFFREKPAFNALREHILPELIHARRGSTRHLRIWSAGCCTGEEAYSIAILLNQLLPDLQAWNLTLLATDINPDFLAKAESGVYSEWSFRDTAPTMKERYFARTSTGRYEIHAAIKRRVTFARLNLVDDLYPPPLNHSGMDVILCRNVLMYFSPEQVQKVIRKLHACLADGGWLIVGLGESSHRLFSDFQTVHFPNAILYRKQPRYQEQGSSQPFKHFRADSLSTFLQGWQESWRMSSVRLTAPEDVPPAGSQAAESQAASQEVESQEAESNTCVEALPQGDEARQRPKSLALYEQGAYAEAEREAHRELAERPEGASVLLLLARICANQGRVDEALTWCKRALAADRLNLTGHYLYATIQEERGEIAEAVMALKRVLYLDPHFVLAYFGLGSLARRQGKLHEAKKHFAQMLSFLKAYRPDEILPESEGLTAGQLAEMVSTGTSLSWRGRANR